MYKGAYRNANDWLKQEGLRTVRVPDAELTDSMCGNEGHSVFVVRQSAGF